jgi:hypothetical protein
MYGIQTLSKPTKTLSLERRNSGQDLNPGPPEYESGLDTDVQLKLLLFLLMGIAIK